MSNGARRPPRLAERLLRMVLPGGVVGDSIVGDAREELAAYVRSGGMAPSVWYWIHATRLACGYVATKGRDVEVGTLFKDLEFGARALLRMPGSAAVAVVVLAIGIGLCSFMFTLVYGVYFRGLDVPDAEEIVHLHETLVERGQMRRGVPIQNFVDWRERQSSFEGLFAATEGTINIADADEPNRFDGASVTSNLLSLLGVEPILGRTFVAGEDGPGAQMNVVLGYVAWRDRYGADPDVVGTEVRVNGQPGTILGVMPEGFQFPDNTEVWVPMRLDPLASARGQGPYVNAYGRLADGVDHDEAAADLASIARQLEREYPEVNEGIGASVMTPSQANLDGTLNVIFAAMMFAVVCVLLVACANVANLLLARAAARTKEAGVRVALGGSRLRVMLPFFAEALVLSLAGALAGMGITHVGVEWFDQVTDPSRTGRPWFMVFEVDLPILAFVIGVSVVTALIAGIVPAFQISRTDVSTVLKDESRGSSGMRVGRLTRLLVTAEVALSVALLVGAGLMTKSIVNLGDIEYPFETDAVFTARAGLFAADYPEEASRQEFWRDLRSEVAALPRVAAAGLTDGLPYNGGVGARIAFEGTAYAEIEELPRANRRVVTPEFFAAMGVDVVAGRDFADQDEATTERVAIVNQPMVDRYFEGRNPVGSRFREGLSDTLPLLTVVGVVPDLHLGGLEMAGEDFEPAGYYAPLTQNDRSFMSIAALTRDGNALSIAGDVRGAVRRLDPDLPIYDVYTLAQIIDQDIWFFAVFGTVFIVFGVAALFMASVGLYGVLSFAVSRRTQEMGIRMALGAASGDVIRLVARQGAGQLAIGLAIGLVLAFGVTRLVALLMYQVDPQDPVVFLSVVSLIVVVGMAAAVFPALRATGVNPVEALRAE